MHVVCFNKVLWQIFKISNNFKEKAIYICLTANLIYNISKIYFCKISWWVQTLDDPKHVYLLGFVKCLKFAFEYNFKLTCMSPKSPYDLVPAYLPNFSLHHSLLNFTLQQSWTCSPSIWCLCGPLCWHMSPPLHRTCAKQTPKSLWTLPPDFQGGLCWYHLDIYQVMVIVSVPLSPCYTGVPGLSVTHHCSSSISPVPTQSRYLGIFWGNKLKLTMWYR